MTEAVCFLPGIPAPVEYLAETGAGMAVVTKKEGLRQPEGSQTLCFYCIIEKQMKGAAKMERTKMCFECGAMDTYELRDTIREYKGEGYSFEMLVRIPFCKVCGAPVYDEEIERNIAERANEKIREQCGIITREEILKILDLYNVSQKFLSKLLGWGEITLTRYISGNYTPNIVNSNKIKELKNPYVFQSLLENFRNNSMEKDEEKLIKKAQAGVQGALKDLEEEKGKIFHVVNWFLSQSTEEAPVTHLALQKLLYFVQSWSRILLGEAMFDDDCEAWVHGAVYPIVYSVFKQFKYKPLPNVEESFEFGESEQRILNAVKKYYFDLYSAKALEEICHREQPYIEAREGLLEKEVCHKVISAEKISLYYESVAKKYNMQLADMSNIKVYLSIMLSY